MGIGILFACFAGNYVADEDYTPIALVLGSLVAITLIFTVGSNAYLLIPLCWPLTGSISLLPLPFNVRQLAMLFAIAIFISGIIFKKTGGKKVPFGLLDLWVWINIGYLVTVFFRNPVGINALGGDRVGGRPYIDVALASLVYIILRKETISPKFAVLLPIVWMSGEFLNASAGLVGTYFPSLGSILGKLYSGFLNGSGGEAQSLVAGEDRLVSLGGLGVILTLFASCKVNPLHFIQIHNFSKTICYLLGLLITMLSGFRNALALIFLNTALAIVLRDRFLGIIKFLAVILCGVLMAILLSYSSINLPWTFQRTLSFLPGNWDPTAVEAAESSSEWRFEMWRIALTSDKYIHNKILGDGFGTSRADYEKMLDAFMGGVGFIGESATQERFMVAGQFHSGPVSAIRFVGYIGLILYLILTLILVKYVYNLIIEARGTPYHFLTLFFGIPLLVSPIYFLFIFGGYEGDIISSLYSVGMAQMIHYSIVQWKKKEEGKNENVSKIRLGA